MRRFLKGPWESTSDIDRQLDTRWSHYLINLESSGLFWDFACVPQHGSNGARRRYDEQQSFERARKHMMSLYASACGTCVLSQSYVPDAAVHDEGYETRVVLTPPPEGISEGALIAKLVALGLPAPMSVVAVVASSERNDGTKARGGVTVRAATARAAPKTCRGSFQTDGRKTGLGAGEMLTRRGSASARAAAGSDYQLELDFDSREDADVATVGLRAAGYAVVGVYNSTPFNERGWVVGEQLAARAMSAHFTRLGSLPADLRRAQARRPKLIDITQHDHPREDAPSETPRDLFTAALTHLKSANFSRESDRPLVRRLVATLDRNMHTITARASITDTRHKLELEYDARVRYLTKRFARHAPRSQFVVWTLLLLMFIASVSPDIREGQRLAARAAANRAERARSNAANAASGSAGRQLEELTITDLRSRLSDDAAAVDAAGAWSIVQRTIEQFGALHLRPSTLRFGRLLSAGGFINEAGSGDAGSAFGEIGGGSGEDGDWGSGSGVYLPTPASPPSPPLPPSPLSPPCPPSLPPLPPSPNPPPLPPLPTSPPPEPPGAPPPSINISAITFASLELEDDAMVVVHGCAFAGIAFLMAVWIRCVRPYPHRFQNSLLIRMLLGVMSFVMCGLGGMYTEAASAAHQAFSAGATVTLTYMLVYSLLALAHHHGFFFWMAATMRWLAHTALGRQALQRRTRPPPQPAPPVAVAREEEFVPEWTSSSLWPPPMMPPPQAPDPAVERERMRLESTRLQCRLAQKNQASAGIAFKMNESFADSPRGGEREGGGRDRAGRWHESRDGAGSWAGVGGDAYKMGFSRQDSMRGGEREGGGRDRAGRWHESRDGTLTWVATGTDAAKMTADRNSRADRELLPDREGAGKDRPGRWHDTRIPPGGSISSTGVILGPDGKPVLGPEGMLMHVDPRVPPGGAISAGGIILGADGKPVLGNDGLPIAGIGSDAVKYEASFDDRYSLADREGAGKDGPGRWHDPRVPPGGSVGKGGMIQDANGDPVPDGDGKFISAMFVGDDGVIQDADGDPVLDVDGQPLYAMAGVGEASKMDVSIDSPRGGEREGAGKDGPGRWRDSRIPAGGSVGKGGIILDVNGMPASSWSSAGKSMSAMVVGEGGVIQDSDGNPVLGADGQPTYAMAGVGGGASKVGANFDDDSPRGGEREGAGREGPGRQKGVRRPVGEHLKFGGLVLPSTIGGRAEKLGVAGQDSHRGGEREGGGKDAPGRMAFRDLDEVRALQLQLEAKWFDLELGKELTEESAELHATGAGVEKMPHELSSASVSLAVKYGGRDGRDMDGWDDGDASIDRPGRFHSNKKLTFGKVTSKEQHAFGVVTNARQRMLEAEWLMLEAKKMEMIESMDARADFLADSANAEATKDGPGRRAGRDARARGGSLAATQGEKTSGLSAADARVAAEQVALEAEWLLAEAEKLAAANVTASGGGFDDERAELRGAGASIATKDRPGRRKEKRATKGAATKGSSTKSADTDDDEEEDAEVAWEAALAKEAKAKQLVLEARWLLLEAEKVPFDADRDDQTSHRPSKDTPGRQTLKGRVAPMVAPPSGSKAEKFSLGSRDDERFDGDTGEATRDGPGRKIHGGAIGMKAPPRPMSMQAALPTIVPTWTTVEKLGDASTSSSTSKEFGTEREELRAEGATRASKDFCSNRHERKRGVIGSLLTMSASKPLSLSAAPAAADAELAVDAAATREAARDAAKAEALRMMAAAEVLHAGTLNADEASWVDISKEADGPAADAVGSKKRTKGLRRQDTFALDLAAGDSGETLKDRPERRGGKRTSVMAAVSNAAAAAVASTVKTLMTNALDAEEDREAHAQAVTDSLLNRGAARARRAKDEEELMDRLGSSSTNAKEKAGRVGKRIGKKNDAAPLEAGDSLEPLARTKAKMRARGIAKAIAVRTGAAPPLGAGVSTSRVATGAGLKGEELRTFLEERQQMRGKEKTKHFKAGGATLSKSRSGADEDLLIELADREGEKEGAGRRRRGSQSQSLRDLFGGKGADDNTPLKRTKQAMKSRKVAARLAEALSGAPSAVGLTQRSDPTTKSKLKNLLSKVAGGAVKESAGTIDPRKGLWTTPSWSTFDQIFEMMPRDSQARAEVAARQSLRVAETLYSRAEAKYDADIKGADQMRQHVDEAYETKKKAALRRTACMTRAELLEVASAGGTIHVDGKSGRVLPPAKRGLVLKLFDALRITRPPTHFIIKFEHKAVPIFMELLTRETSDADILGTGVKPAAKTFYLEKQLETIEAAYEFDKAAADHKVEEVKKAFADARLDADRSAVQVLVRIEGIDVDGDEQFSPREKRESLIGKSNVMTTRSPDGMLTNGASGTNRKNMHSVSAPPRRRLPNQKEAAVAPSTRTEDQTERLKKLEARIARNMVKREGDMEARTSKTLEVKEKMREAARNMPAATRLPAPNRPAHQQSSCPRATSAFSSRSLAPPTSRRSDGTDTDSSSSLTTNRGLSTPAATQQPGDGKAAATMRRHKEERQGDHRIGSRANAPEARLGPSLDQTCRHSAPAGSPSMSTAPSPSTGWSPSQSTGSSPCVDERNPMAEARNAMAGSPSIAGSPQSTVSPPSGSPDGLSTLRVSSGTFRGGVTKRSAAATMAEKGFTVRPKSRGVDRGGSRDTSGEDPLPRSHSLTSANRKSAPAAASVPAAAPAENDDDFAYVA